MMTRNTALYGIALAVVAVQLFDVAIHVGTGQAEPVRLLSNAVIGLWAIIGLAGRESARLGLAAIILYLGLNGWFLAAHGLTNPAQGGAPRVTLFVLVAATTALSAWLWAKTRQE